MYMETPFRSEPYSSKDGKVIVNLHPPREWRIWICMKCTNDFQTVTTKPFMVDVQCDEASVEIVPPQTLQSGWAYNTLL
jgi:hypothetical protein